MAAPIRVSIVTGAAQGIGEAIALRLADDGLDVAIFDLPQKRDLLESVAETIRTKGRRALVCVGDVSIEADIANLVQRSVEELGGLDVMVSNAGIFHSAALGVMSVEDWDRVFAINTRGTMLCFKHAAQQMVKQGRGGRIIGAASTTAKKGYSFVSSYCASKFAIRGLAQCAASELREHNITVNTYAPGLIETPATTHPDDEINGGPCTTLLKNTGWPVKTKVAPPSVVAGLISYLVRPEADFVTGQCLSVDGGLVMS